MLAFSWDLTFALDLMLFTVIWTPRRDFTSSSLLVTIFSVRIHEIQALSIEVLHFPDLTSDLVVTFHITAAVNLDQCLISPTCNVLRGFFTIKKSIS
ncbi:hypothetical protein GDO81_028834 [Engystomops pustulosus]|uniref:Secreted protein n=1 Tax=Engystomops pustulosus TaxID=76066 RepID=A0AAV6ZCK6_ENGPU|nr:hypothetical protein GDO81_028834 [Engystomops pustulosus]